MPKHKKNEGNRQWQSQQNYDSSVGNIGVPLTSSTTPIHFPPPPPPPPPPLPQSSIQQHRYQYPNHFQVTLPPHIPPHIPPPPPPRAPLTFNSVSTNRAMISNNYNHYSTNSNIIPPPPPPPPPPPRPPPYMHTQLPSSQHHSFPPQNTNININNSSYNRNFKRQKTKNINSFQKIKPSSNQQHVYSCPLCPNQTFNTEKGLFTHTSSHITCQYPQCSYTASPALVNAHYSKAHGRFSGTGIKTIQIQIPGYNVQKFNVCVGDDPEDIQKWIQERKRHFPTRKRREEAVTAFSTTSNPKRSWKDEGKDVEDTKVLLGLTTKGMDICHDLETRTKQDSNHVIQTNDDDKDDDDEGALSTLLAGYDSSSSNDDKDQKIQETTSNLDHPSPSPTEQMNPNNKNKDKDKEKEGNNPIETSTTTTILAGMDHPSNHTNPKQNMCHFFLRNGRCKRGNQCRYLHDAKAHAEFLVTQRTTKTGRTRKQTQNRKVPNTVGNTTLLKQLLEREMRREASLTLQCLRFMCHNRFFLDLTTTSTSSVVAKQGTGNTHDNKTNE